MQYFLHSSDFADFEDSVLIGIFDTVEEARAAAAAGDPEKFHSIINNYGYDCDC